jgi:hypothetical protein
MKYFMFNHAPYKIFLFLITILCLSIFFPVQTSAVTIDTLDKDFSVNVNYQGNRVEHFSDLDTDDGTGTKSINYKGTGTIEITGLYNESGFDVGSVYFSDLVISPQFTSINFTIDRTSPREAKATCRVDDSVFSEKMAFTIFGKVNALVGDGSGSGTTHLSNYFQFNITIYKSKEVKLGPGAGGIVMATVKEPVVNKSKKYVEWMPLEDVNVRLEGQNGKYESNNPYTDSYGAAYFKSNIDLSNCGWLQKYIRDYVTVYVAGEKMWDSNSPLAKLNIPYAVINDVVGDVSISDTLGPDPIRFYKGYNCAMGQTITFGRATEDQFGMPQFPGVEVWFANGVCMKVGMKDKLVSGYAVALGENGLSGPQPVMTLIEKEFHTYTANLSPRVGLGIEKIASFGVDRTVDAGLECMGFGFVFRNGLKYIINYLDNDDKGSKKSVMTFSSSAMYPSYNLNRAQDGQTEILITDDGALIIRNTLQPLKVSGGSNEMLVPQAKYVAINTAAGGVFSDLIDIPADEKTTYNFSVSPLNGSTLATRTPVIALNYPYDLDPINTSSFICRINGKLVPNTLMETEQDSRGYWYKWTVPSSMQLKGETNNVTVFAFTSQKHMICTGQSTFSIPVDVPVTDMQEEQEDLNAKPLPPSGITAIEENSKIWIQWNPSTRTDFQGYSVYRAEYGQPFEKQNPSLLREPEFRSELEKGKVYLWALTVTDNSNRESDFSNVFYALVLNFDDSLSGAPRVADIDPGNQDTGIPIGKSVTVFFNKMVEMAEGYHNIKLFDSGGGELLIDVYWGGGDRIFIAPSIFTMRTGEKYKLFIPRNAVKDSKGNNLATDITSYFTTQHNFSKPEDTRDYKVWTSTPIKVKWDKVWKIEFNQELELDTISYSNIHVNNDKTNEYHPIKLEKAYDIYKKKTSVVVNFNKAYTPGQSYTLYIEPEIKSSSGTNLRQGVLLRFTVEE